MLKIAVLGALLGCVSAGFIGGPVFRNHDNHYDDYDGYDGYGPSDIHHGFGHEGPLNYIGVQPVVHPLVHPAVHPVVEPVVQVQPYSPPSYNFGYGVTDGITGDQKSHSETRYGDVVKGQYSLVEPDGNVRTVTYAADSLRGFNAHVHNSRGTIHAHAPAVAPVYAVAKGQLVHH